MYTLQHWEGDARPYRILRPDGSQLYSCTAIDKRFAMQIVANLNSIRLPHGVPQPGLALSPEDSDELLAQSA